MIRVVNASGPLWADNLNWQAGCANARTFLRDFVKGWRTQVCQVVVAHSAHIATTVTDYITQNRGRLEFHFLPSYAPYLNPKVFVWSCMQDKRSSQEAAQETRIHAPTGGGGFGRCPSEYEYRGIIFQGSHWSLYYNRGSMCAFCTKEALISLLSLNSYASVSRLKSM